MVVYVSGHYKRRRAVTRAADFRFGSLVIPCRPLSVKPLESS
jgi:hypothetical protein